jgi:hypothetical protein
MNNSGPSNGNQTGNTGKTNTVTTSCSNWGYDGNGKFSDKLDGILTQINIAQSGSNGIKIYLMEQGRDLPINSGFKYRLGVVWSEINENDVTVFYQSDDRTANLPFTVSLSKSFRNKLFQLCYKWTRIKTRPPFLGAFCCRPNTSQLWITFSDFVNYPQKQFFTVHRFLFGNLGANGDFFDCSAAI